MDNNIALKISARLLNESNICIGSGFLFVPSENKAYFFTAAHVINNSSSEKFILEAYHESPENNEEYIFFADKDDFKIHPSFPNNFDNGFTPYDIAGLEIEKRDWMKDIPEFFVAAPRNGISTVSVGYPQNTYDKDIPFANLITNSNVQFTEPKYQRTSLILTDSTLSRADLANDLKGMSGSCFMFGDNCVTGIWISGQGAIALGGKINGLTEDAIIDLCSENSWPIPASKFIEEYKEDGKTAFRLSDNEPRMSRSYIPESESSLYHYAKDNIKSQLQAIDTKLKNLEFEDVIKDCDNLKETLGKLSDCETEKSIVATYKAYALLYNGDIAGAKETLDGYEDYPSEQKAVAYMVFTEIELRQNNIQAAKDFITRAKESGGEKSQVIILGKYLSILEDTNIELSSAIKLMEYTVKDIEMTAKEWQQYYCILSNICVIKYRDFDNAISYLNKAYSIAGDKALLLTIGQCYYQKAELSFPSADYPSFDYAVQYFSQYLSYCDETAKHSFYIVSGVQYINSLLMIHNNREILDNIDSVIDVCSDEAAISQLQRIKLRTQTLLGEASISDFKNTSEIDKKIVLLSKEFEDVSASYQQLLNNKYAIDFNEKKGHIIPDAVRLENKKETAFHKAEQRDLADRTIAFIDKYCTEENSDIFSPLYYNVIMLEIYLKNVDGYNRIINCIPEKARQKINLDTLTPLKYEVEGNVAKTIELFKEKLEKDYSYTNIQDLISVYMRNSLYDEIIELYKTVLENKTIGNFHRDQLIQRYIDYLLLPNCNNVFALEEYLNYRPQINDNGLVQIYDLQFDFLIDNYNHYEEISSFLSEEIKSNPSEIALSNAMTISIYNLKSDEASYYFHELQRRFPDYANRPDSVDCINTYRSYTGTNGAPEGKSTLLNNPRFDEAIKNNVVPMIQNKDIYNQYIDNGVAITDAYSLYYLAKQGLLDKLAATTKELIIPFSVIKLYISELNTSNDKTIHNIFDWINNNKNVKLYESEFKAQASFRKEYGDNNWALKSALCISVEKDIPAICTIVCSDCPKKLYSQRAIWLPLFLDTINNKV